LAEKSTIVDDEAAMERRRELIRNFILEEHSRGVAQRFLEQVQQKERETKPVVLESVRAAPLKIDVTKWEAPKYKKESHEKALIKDTARQHFLFKEQINESSESKSNSSTLDKGIASNTVSALIKAFEPIKYAKGKTIIQQGKIDEHMYVVEPGTVKFENGDDVTDVTGCPGTTFGHQNLILPVPAERTVVAAESTKVYRLHQETYRGILQQRHLAEDAKKREKERERKQKEKQRMLLHGKKIVEGDDEWWKDDEKAQLQIAVRKALEKVHQDDLERIRVLGEGQFGEVWLVAADLEVEREKPKRYEFALKLQETFDDYREETAQQEIRMMKEVSGYPFVSMLYKSYETEESKDMLLGLIPGGELWDTIHKEDEATGEWYSGLCEGHARFYTMVVADTLEYLHSESFVFRDLKPENIMLDGWGYPIIVDFGFCKRLPKGRNDKTFTFCGTPNYVAPEMILNVGHNGAADCWALGIVIYEMVSGMNPFFYEDIDNVELFRSIVEDEGVVLNEKNHSQQVRKLVDGLLEKDPDKRLDAKGVLSHAWFEGLSLKWLRKRQIRAPWIPPGGEGETAEYFNDRDDEKEAKKKRREQQIEEELKRREEEERLRKQREEEKELRRQQELEEQRRREEEKEERLRIEEELRIQQDLEEERLREKERKREERRRRRKEEKRMQREREEEERRLTEEEEVLRRLEEEEQRLRQEEREVLRRLEEEKERRLQKEEEVSRRREEEELRLQMEREEEERMREEEELFLQEDKERRFYEEKLRLQAEDEDRRRRLEEDSQEERLEEVRRQQREVAEARARRIAQEQGLLPKESEGHRSVGEMRWDQGGSPVNSQLKSIEDLIGPVPKGIVSQRISDSTRKTPSGIGGQSPGTIDVRTSVKRGIVAKRVSAAKQKENPANIPSLFSSW